MSVPLSVLILTKNEARNIGACLDSVVGWASQIVVVDSGSTDGTLEECARRGVSVLFHPYTDHRSQLQWALTSIPWQHEWLLLIDADNIVTPRFRADVEEMLRNDTGTVHGFYSRHQLYFRGRPVRGVTTGRLRLIRRQHARVDDSELVDFRFIVEGRVGRLRGTVMENNQNELDIDFWIDKQQKFARRLAIEQILRTENVLAWSAGIRPRLFGHQDERVIWLKNVWYGFPLYLRPILFFLYRYVLRGGFLDGSNGFVFHAMHAFWFRLLVDVHVADYRDQLRRGALTLNDLLAAAGGATQASRDL